MEGLDEDKLKELYREVVVAVEGGNYRVSVHNVSASWTTGSHNNCQLLGSMVQAKGAIFYICPHMGKRKRPLLQCLTLLRNAAEHIEKHPSVAKDAGTKERKVKHLLQRTLNKMNLMMELSDYQIAADLLNLPSIICSEVFAYGNPEADLAYQKHVHVQRDSKEALDRAISAINQVRDEQECRAAMLPGGEMEDFIVPDEEGLDDKETSGGHDASMTDEDVEEVGVRPQADVDEGDMLESPSALRDGDNDVLEKEMGTVKLFTLTEASVTREDPLEIKVLVPRSSFYPNRGLELRQLNRHEYRAFVHVREKRVNCLRERKKEFSFSDDFLLASHYVQVLGAKQRTVILTSKPPSHPGEKSSASNLRSQKRWVRRADAYARCYLSEFRPELDCYLTKHVNKYEYTWEALEQWIDEMRCSIFVMSHLRLVLLDTRMKELHTEYSTKVMLSQYRARNRKLWTEEEQEDYAADYAMRRKLMEKENLVDQYLFEQEHSELNAEQNRQMDFQLSHNDEQLSEFMVTENRSCRRARRKRDYDSLLHGNNKCDKGSAKDCRALGKKLRRASIVPRNSSLTGEEERIVRSKREEVLTARMKEREEYFDTEQSEFYETYHRYMTNLGNDACRPPDVSLLHGAAGSGKSDVLKNIIDLAELRNLGMLRTAFNAINAIGVGGRTTLSIILLVGTGESLAKVFQLLGETKLVQVQDLVKNVVVILLDEVSNQAPYHLAQLSWVCQQGTGNYEKPFGGIPAVLAGDLGQIGPVKAGLSLTEAAMKICAHRHDRR